MDFFQFLQKSTDDSNTKKTKKKSSNVTDTNELKKQKSQETTSKETTSREIEQTHLYIKRGDMVKIVNVPNSRLNNYKGYIGEIKDYKQDQDFALVFLHGITYMTIIKFPLLHLIKYNP